MRRRYKPAINHNSEFELDLAPLLAVMVKLVPVMLISSAFVQMMMVETELPQIVQAAIAKQEQQLKNPVIMLSFDRQHGIEILVEQDGDRKTEHIDLTSDKKFDYAALNKKMQAVKTQYPEAFKVQFDPGADVSYKEIVRLMDEVRQSREKSVRFPIKDTKTGEMTTTDYMFPEVIFSQMTEG